MKNSYLVYITGKDMTGRPLMSPYVVQASGADIQRKTYVEEATRHALGNGYSEVGEVFFADAVHKAVEYGMEMEGDSQAVCVDLHNELRRGGKLKEPPNVNDAMWRIADSIFHFQDALPSRSKIQLIKSIGSNQPSWDRAVYGIFQTDDSGKRVVTKLAVEDLDQIKNCEKAGISMELMLRILSKMGVLEPVLRMIERRVRRLTNIRREMKLDEKEGESVEAPPTPKISTKITENENRTPFEALFDDSREFTMGKFQPADISINFEKIRNQLGLKGIDDAKLQDMVRHAVVDQLREQLGMDVNLDDLDVASVDREQSSRLEGKMRFADKNWFTNESEDMEAKPVEIPYRVALDENSHSITIMSNPGRAGIETKVEVDLSPGGLTNIKVFGPTDGLLATLVQKGDVALIKEGKFADMEFSATHNNCMVLTRSSADPQAVLTLVERMPNLLADDSKPKLDGYGVEHEQAEDIDYSNVKSPEPSSRGPGGMG